VKRRIAVAALLSGGALFATAGPAGAQELSADAVKVDLDNAYVLLSAVLVIFMQAGFALVEAGMTRAKSVANIMMKNLMDFMAGVVAFFCVGYAFAFGAGNDLIGWKGFFLGDGTLVREPRPVRVLRVSARVRRDRGHDRLGCDGRTHEVQGLLRLQHCDHRVHLPGGGALVLGRGLARARWTRRSSTSPAPRSCTRPAAWLHSWVQ
jgi:hypothetical protein